MESNAPLVASSEAPNPPESPSSEAPTTQEPAPTKDQSIETLMSQLKAMEDRVKALESEKKEPAPENKSESSAKRKTKITPTIRWCDWEQFKNTFADEEGHDAIDVLWSGEQLKDEVRQEFSRRIQVDDGSFNEAQAPPSSSSAVKKKRWIQHIRIRSKIVLSMIERISSRYKIYHLNVDMPVIFLEPFKSLIYVHDELKKAIRDIPVKTTATNGDNDQAGSALNAASESAKKDPTSEKPSTAAGNATQADTEQTQEDDKSRSKDPIDEDELAELNCYVQFVDEYIIPRFNQLRKGNHEGDFSKKVRFQDMWMLFQPGELVYVPEPSSVSKRKATTEQRVWRMHKFYDAESNWKFDHIEKAHYSSIGRKKKKKDADDADDADADADDADDNDKMLICYYLDYTGTTFCPVSNSWSIEEFDGEVDITSLRVYPLRFHPNRDAIAKLREERAHFVEYAHTRNKRQMLYEGWSITKNVAGMPMDGMDDNQIYIDSEVVIDFDEVFQSRPMWKPEFFWSIHHGVPRCEWRADPVPVIHWENKKRSKKLSQEKDLIQVWANFNVVEWNEWAKLDPYITVSSYTATNEPHKIDRIEGEDILLLPTRLFAYSFRERSYFQIDIRGLREIEKVQDPFASLEIDYGHKRTIESLLHTHFENMDLNRGPGPTIPDQDLIRGKGRGIVILLHGAPGVGKTATAEAVAQKYDKPLFSIGCGDLGYQPDSVESALTEIFRLAQVWNCVLLLDEADVFLTQRSINDLKRNAMVSTILRILEYYKGVLFLTTNRPGSLDEALKSRVHVSLHYEPLNLDKVHKIFKINLDRLEIIEEARKKSSGSQGMYIFREEILAYAKEHFEKYGNDSVGSWNGRQIRNSFQVAAAMARYDGLRNPGSQVQLHASHFRDVAIATQKYDEFRQRTLRKTDPELARANKFRDDSYVFSPERSVATDPVGPQGYYDSARRQLYPQAHGQPSELAHEIPSYNTRPHHQAGYSGSQVGYSSPKPPSSIPRTRTPLTGGSPSPHPSHSQTPSQGGYSGHPTNPIPFGMRMQGAPGTGQQMNPNTAQQQMAWSAQHGQEGESVMRDVDQMQRESGPEYYGNY